MKIVQRSTEVWYNLDKVYNIVVFVLFLVQHCQSWRKYPAAIGLITYINCTWLNEIHSWCMMLRVMSSVQWVMNPLNEHGETVSVVEGVSGDPLWGCCLWSARVNQATKFWWEKNLEWVTMWEWEVKGACPWFMCGALIDVLEEQCATWCWRLPQ